MRPGRDAPKRSGSLQSRAPNNSYRDAGRRSFSRECATTSRELILRLAKRFSIEKSSAVNRKLYARLEAEQLFPDGDFSLEVSSPGVDEPLSQLRQYKKNIGRKVTVTDNEGIEKTGTLKDVTDEQITLEIKPAKQKEALIITQIPFSNVKKTVVQVIF